MKARRTPGEPLVALAFILVGWIAMRAYAWERALDTAGVPGAGHSLAAPAPARHAAQRWAITAATSSRAAPRPGQDWTLPAHPGIGHPAMDFRSPLPLPLPADLPQLAPPPPAGPAPLPAAMAPATAEPAAPPTSRIAVAGGHQLLWLAATALLPLPPLGLRDAAPARAAEPLRPLPRWSGDAWLFVRRGREQIVPGPLAGVYGASQVGAVLRYRLAPADAHRPTAYLRGTGAINGTREQEVALGLSARPLGRVPLSAVAELRAERGGQGTVVRPSVGVVTELAPQQLPLGFTGEAYVQAGWIGGRNSSAYVDGLIRAERKLTDLGSVPLRAGAGAWGARQRGASRLDIGPVASLGLHLGNTANARLEADWRFRVGGRAKPDSGPTLTLSAGF